MKLVDILARDLKEWPPGLECLSQLKGTGYIINGKGFDGRAFDALEIADETHIAGAIVTRDQWQSAVYALKADSPSLHIQQVGRCFRALSSDPDDVARAHISNLIYGAMSKLGQAPTVDQVTAAASALTDAGYQQFEIIDEPKS